MIHLGVSQNGIHDHPYREDWKKVHRGDRVHDGFEKEFLKNFLMWICWILRKGLIAYKVRKEVRNSSATEPRTGQSIYPRKSFVAVMVVVESEVKCVHVAEVT